MTVIIGITTPDGVILASESRTTGAGRILSDSAQKVFAVGRFGVATTGAAFISENTIAGLMDQFVAQLGDEDVMDVEFADALGRFFDRRFLAAWAEELEHAAAHGEHKESDDDLAESDDEGPQDGEEGDDIGWDTERLGYALTFLVAGYDADGIGHIHEVKIPGPDKGDYSPNTTERGVLWRGQTDVITRMLKGVDTSGLVLPLDEIPEEVLGAIRDGFDGLEYLHLFPITAQDAVDYASFLIRTTIDMQRFSNGTVADPGLIPGCGGPLQILVVERDQTRWAAKPDLRITRDERI